SAIICAENRSQETPRGQFEPASTRPPVEAEKQEPTPIVSVFSLRRGGDSRLGPRHVQVSLAARLGFSMLKVRAPSEVHPPSIQAESDSREILNHHSALAPELTLEFGRRVHGSVVPFLGPFGDST